MVDVEKVGSDHLMTNFDLAVSRRITMVLLDMELGDVAGGVQPYDLVGHRSFSPLCGQNKRWRHV